MLALLDYGAGNLASVRKGFAAVGAVLFTPATPGELMRADAIIVPGVGHFGGMRHRHFVAYPSAHELPTVPWP